MVLLECRLLLLSIEQTALHSAERPALPTRVPVDADVPERGICHALYISTTLDFVPHAHSRRYDWYPLSTPPPLVPGYWYAIAIIGVVSHYDTAVLRQKTK